MRTIIAKLYRNRIGLWLVLLTVGPAAFAQGTAFTYQGRLTDNNSPGNGIYDIGASLFATNTGGPAIAGPITNTGVTLSNGLFTISLDFGNVFNGTPFWLEIAVRTNGASAFTTLTPRQQLTPSPYALYAEGGNAAGLNGTLPATALGGTYSNAVTFNNGANTFDGTFVGQFFGPTFIGGSFSGNHFGDGGGLYNLNPTQLTGTVPDSKLAANIARTNQVWLLNGNTGTTAGPNFVGTTDNQPLELRVNGQRVVRFTPDVGTNNAPIIVGGSSANTVAPGIVGATISGGGASMYGGLPGSNTVYGDFNTIGGGWGNTAGGTNFNVAQATVGGGAYNTANGISSAIAGGSYNVAYNNDAAIAGGFQNRANFRTAVAGGEHNWADGAEAAVGGGFYNSIQTNTYFAVVGGGYVNTVQGSNYEAGSTIGGGGLNLIQPAAVFDAGYGLYMSFSTVGGGFGNQIQNNSSYSTVDGGVRNTIQPNSAASSIGGGTNNLIQGNDWGATIGGGALNLIYANAPCAVVAGGLRNTNGGFASSIGGGQGNTTAGGDGAVVGGGYFNGSEGSAATVGGGQYNFVGTYADHGTIAGGQANTIAGSFALPVGCSIGGGVSNSIQTNISYSTIAGGSRNVIQPLAHLATVGGGSSNVINGPFAVIPGGDQNLATNNAFAAGHRAKAGLTGSFVWADSTDADFAATTSNQFSVRASGGVVFATGGAGITVDGQIVAAANTLTNFWQLNGNSGTSPANGNFLGTTDNQPLEFHVKGQRAMRLEPDNSGPGAPNVIGGTNFVGSSAFGVFIGGGYLNTNSGNYSTIGGGNQNQISPIASYAVIAGGNGNQILAGNFSTISGGVNNTNVAPFATIPGGVGNTAGANAFAAGSGAQAFNQGSFVWADAAGINPISSTNNNSVTFRADGGYRLYSNAGATLGVFLGHNGVSWSSISDRNAKTNFAPMDCENVLNELARIPIQRWNYKWEPEGTPTHIGPMAQDFKPVFYPGSDDKSISTLEFDGVELAAIQGLNQKLKEKDAQIAVLETRLERMEKLVAGMLPGPPNAESVTPKTSPDKKIGSTGD